jgi:hypothetical protein
MDADCGSRCRSGPLLCVITGPTRGITSIYLHGIDNAEIIDTAHPAERR